VVAAGRRHAFDSFECRTEVTDLDTVYELSAPFCGGLEASGEEVYIEPKLATAISF
jgi:hypothetical protein